MIIKVLKIIGLVLLGILIVIFCYFFVGKTKPVSKIDFGVSFSKIQAQELKLDWKKAYLEILNDLKIKKIRLIAYWPEIEPQKKEFDFKDLDWQIKKAEENNAEIILALGQRLPRWPECHIPNWAKNLTKQEKQENLLVAISKTINHYKGIEAIKYWQIENEPFLGTFGECPKLDKKFLDKEISLVKDLDPSRRIILTASGELSTWIGAAKRSDILGTSLYRIVYSSFLKRYIHYPIPAIFYVRKTKLIKELFDIDKIIVIELQAEPWGSKSIKEMSVKEQSKSMDKDKLEKIINYTKQAGFSEAYLWGAEWWYWLKTKHNDNSMWEEAKKLFVGVAPLHKMLQYEKQN